LGIHDDLLTHLSQIEAINVISRTSVLGYRGTTKSVSQIADELGASVILEGGVQRSGDRIRMNVQLIDAETDEHLWAEQYDRTLTTENVFAIQAEIAERIASAMETTLTPEQKADLAEAPTDNLEALDLYYQGLDAYRGRGGIVTSDSRNAVHFLDRATELDPDFAAAWAALAQARAWLIRIGMVSDTTATRAALERAAALAPDARETKLAEGVYLYYARADFAGAADRFSALLRRQPDDAEALNWQGLVQRRLGRWDEALVSMESARDADPRNSGIVSNLGVTLLHLRRYDEAERYLDEALVLSSSDDALTNKVILLLWGKGDTRGARGFLEASARNLDPGGYALLDAMVALGERDYESGIETLEGELIPQDQKPTALYLQALHARLAGRTDLSAVMGDSLVAVSEGQITAYREGGADPFGFQSQLTAFRGLAHALAGRRSEAVKDGRRAVEMLPVSQDAIEGEIVLVNLAMIYALVGDRDAAIRTLERLLSIPSELGPGRLRLDPTFDSLRGDPRFESLIEKAEAAERSGTGTR
jgi:TolB-like protein/Flp pilus assembly protein TadD